MQRLYPLYCLKLPTLVLAVVFVLSLGGCASKPSASSDAAYSTAAEQATAEAVAEADVGAPETRTESAVQPSLPAADSQALPSGAALQPSARGRELLVQWSANFEVSGVAEAAREIEALTRRHGGYVARSHVYTLNLGTQEFASGGELVGVQRYTRQAELYLRVPRQHMTAFADDLQRQVVFLGESDLSATDVTLDLLRETWAAELARAKAEALEAERAEAGDADEREANLKAIEREFAAREARNADELARRDLEGRLELSAVSLTLTQGEMTRRTVRPDPAAQARAYAPSYRQRLSAGARRGWQAVQSLSVWLVTLWPVWVLLGALGAVWWLWRSNKAEKTK